MVLISALFFNELVTWDIKIGLTLEAGSLARPCGWTGVFMRQKEKMIG
jgi:hypothetical protein